MEDIYSTASEKELVEYLKSGEIKAFEELYKRHKVKMYNTALRIHRDHLDAEDSVQEAFVKIYRNISSFKGRSQFSTWIYRILYNTCMENLRKKKGTLRMEQTDFTDELEQEKLKASDGDPSLKFVIEREIRKLPDEMRAVFVLYEVEGFKHREIAEIMSIPDGTSKSHLFKAKSLLREYLKPYLEIFGEI